MSSLSNLPPVGATSPGVPANDSQASAADTVRNGQTSPSSQNPSLGPFPRRPSQGTQDKASRKGIAGTGSMRHSAAPSAKAKARDRIIKRAMGPELKEMRPQLLDPWDELNEIYLGKNAYRPDDESGEWIEKARSAAKTFAGTLSRLVQELRGTYNEEGKFEDFLLNKKDADFLSDPNNALIKQLALFTDTARRLTDFKEVLGEIKHAYRPLLDKSSKLAQEVPTSALLELIDELESSSIWEQCQILLKNRHKHSEQASDPFREFDDELRKHIIEVLSQAIELKLALYRTAVQKVSIDEYSDTIKALDATSDPISTQEQSEAFLLELEPKATEALDVLQRQLECLDAYIAMLDDVIKAPDSSPGLSGKARDRSNDAKAARVTTLHTLARTLTYTLSKSSIVDATEDWPKSWQAEMYGRIYDLSSDASTCYQGTSGVKYRHLKKVPERIRPDVAALVADKASSIIVDLQRIEGQLASSSLARALVKPLLPIIEEIEKRLIDEFAQAKSTLRESIEGSRPHVADAIKKLEADALTYAAAHLRSFSARPHEEWSEPSEGLSNATSRQRSSRDESQRTRQAAALVQSEAQGFEQEIEAIARRLTSLEENVLAAFRGLPARADSLLEATKEDGKASETPSMTLYTLCRNLEWAHEDCEKAIAKLRKSIRELANDDEFARNGSAPSHLKKSIADMQRKIHSLIADLSKRLSELSTAAKLMGRIEQTTRFVRRPTWELFNTLPRDDLFALVERTVTREPTSHASDYLTEYVLYLKRPDQPADLVDETYCVVVHVHYPGKDAKKASACHFKTWAQRGLTEKNSESPVHHGRVPADDAPDFIDHLEASRSTRRRRRPLTGGRRRPLTGGRRR